MLNGDDIYGENTFKSGFEMMQVPDRNIIGGLKVIDTLPKKGTVNRGIIFVKNNKVTGLKEMINISKEDNPELHNELANVNFIGLQVDILYKLKIILDNFKLQNEDDPKIECILTDNLSQLISENKLNMEFFEITDRILGITNPGDEDIVKDLIKQ